jgi:hypothetical protein
MYIYFHFVCARVYATHLTTMRYKFIFTADLLYIVQNFVLSRRDL